MFLFVMQFSIVGVSYNQEGYITMEGRSQLKSDVPTTAFLNCQGAFPVNQ